MARPTYPISGEFSTIGATSATLTASDYSGATTADAIAVFIDLQEDDQTVTAPAGWVEIGQTELPFSAFGTSVSCFVLPPGTAKSGNYTFTYPSNTYQGAMFAVVRGTNLRYQAGNAIDGDDNGGDIHIAGLPAGGVDRLGLAGVSSYNATFTVDEGDWTLLEQSNGNFSGLFVNTSVGTGAVADLDTGLNDGSGSHASVSVVFYESIAFENIPDLEAHWDASDPAGVTDSSGDVTAWVDLSPNGHDVTQNNAGFYPSTGTRTANSLNVLDFDGGDNLGVGNDSWWEDLPEHTTFVVFENDVAGNAALMYAGNSTDADVEHGLLILGDKLNFVRLLADGTIQFFIEEPTNVTTATGAQIARFSDDGSTASLALNDGTPVTASYTRAAVTTNRFVFGTRIKTSADLELDGYIAEAIVFDRVLDSDEIALVETYLADKWQVAAGGVTGTAAVPLGGLTVTVSGERERTATVAAPLGALTASASGTRGRAGTVSVPLGGLTVAAVGESGTDVTGTVAGPLGALTTTVAGERERIATVDAPLGALTVVGAGVRGRTGTATVALGELTVAVVGDGISGVTGTATVPLGGLTAAGTGVRGRAGTATVPLGALTTVVSGERERIATVSVPFGALTVTVAGVRGRTGSVAVPLGGLTVVGVGDGNTGGNAAVPLGGLAVAVTGVRGRTGTGTVALGGLLVAVVGEGETAALADVPLGELGVTADGTRGRTGTANVPLGALTLAVIGVDVALALVIVGRKGTARHTPPRATARAVAVRSTGRTPDSVRTTELPSGS